jgi:hypothetical protein
MLYHMLCYISPSKVGGQCLIKIVILFSSEREMPSSDLFHLTWSNGLEFFFQ